MTITDAALGPDGSSGPHPTPLDAEAVRHRLQEGLQLGLGALLVSLCGNASAGPHRTALGGQALPWRRWLTEDTQLTQLLYGALLDAHADPDPGWSAGAPDPAPASLLEDLATHYAVLRDLLTDLHVAAPPAWHEVTADALRRCRLRLLELETDHSVPVPAPVSVPGSAAVP